MNTITQRLKMLLDDLHITPSAFSRTIGLKSLSTISHTIKLDREVSGNIISKILTTYPELNSDWLIYGRGEIWKKSLLRSRLSPENNIELCSIANRINKIIVILNISISKFAEIVGSNKVTIHNLITGATHNLSIDLLTKITKAYPEINQDWLLAGNGNPTHSFND